MQWQEMATLLARQLSKQQRCDCRTLNAALHGQFHLMACINLMQMLLSI